MSSEGAGGIVVVALVAIVPLVALMLTSFVKISVVLALLRNALGAPEAPSGLVVMGVSLVLTFFVMAPVGIEMIQAAATAPPGDPGGAGADPGGAGVQRVPGGEAVQKAPAGEAVPKGPAGETVPKAPGGEAGAKAGEAATGEEARGRIDVGGAVRQLVPEGYRREVDAAARAIEPLRAFLGKHAAERDRETFVEVARRMGRDVDGREAWVLAPAFLTTELREAFAIAVLIFVPFLVIDLVVALGLAALGLQVTQPQVVALPLKLLLFVAVDGWRLLIEGLVRGYA